MSASDRTVWHSEGIDKGYPVDSKNEVRTLCHIGQPGPMPNLISSLRKDGRHAPALDLDVPSQYRLSSTPGHAHLLIDAPMRWWRYRLLLRTLVFCGIIDKKYYRHCVNRRMSMLRLPHVKKGIKIGEVTWRVPLP